MSRWHKTKKENCEDVSNNKISNLHSAVYTTLLYKMLSADLRAELNLVTSAAKGTKQYWLLRGWPSDIAYIKAAEHSAKHKRVSVFSKEYWTNKINTTTGIYYTDAEAEYEGKQ